MRKSPLVLLAVALLVAGRATAADPSARDLIALAPYLSSADPAMRSIELAGSYRIPGNVRLRFRALYRAPDRFTFLLMDGHEGTPLAFSAERKSIVYDPIRPAVDYCKDTQFSFFMKGLKNGCLSGILWHYASTEPNVILLDLRSMFNLTTQGEPGPRDEVVRTGDGRYMLTRKWEKTYIRSRVDLTRPQPFMTVEFGNYGEPRGFMAVDTIVVNGAIKDSELAFPDLNRLARTLNVNEIKDDASFKHGDFSHAMRSFYVREALYDPKLRAGDLGARLKDVRWDLIERNDREYAPLLRDFVATGAGPRLANRPPAKADQAVRRSGFPRFFGRRPSDRQED